MRLVIMSVLSLALLGLTACFPKNQNPVIVDPEKPKPLESLVPGQVLVILAPPGSQSSIDQDALSSFLSRRNYGLTSAGLSSLSSDIGPCAGELALVRIGDTPLDQALKDLAALEDEGIAVILAIDGESAFDSGQEDYQTAIRSDFAKSLGLSAKGSTLAVLDTGVTRADHLLPGYNAILNTTDPATTLDDYPAGHGTRVAAIAQNIAPDLMILPVKVCDEKGNCLASSVIKGICWALGNAPKGPEQLVMNLSLGNDHPSPIIEALLAAAINSGTAVAAAGGNDGANGLLHYPAAFDLPGLLAVGAVEQCASFEDVAPGQYQTALMSGPLQLSLKGLTPEGKVTVIQHPKDTFTDTELLLEDVRLGLNFLGVKELSFIQFDVSNTGENPSVILSINGETLRAKQTIDLHDQSIANVKIIVEEFPLSYRVMLQGSISNLALTANLMIDDICAGNAALGNWFPASYSTHGDYIDIAAPGFAGVDTGYGLRGTSFSSPQAAATMALLQSADPRLSPETIQTCIEKGATPLNDPPNTPEAVGAGLLNIEGAIRQCLP